MTDLRDLKPTVLQHTRRLTVKFWIGTNNGLSCYIPGFVDTATLKPLVNLLFVEDASGRQFSLSHLNNFAFDQNDLTFHYRGLSFIDESKNKFHLYLKNISVDSKNEYITSEIKVRFSNLAPGQYVFSVALENSKGILSAAVKSGIITIEKPFYSQVWFYFSISAVIIFIIYSIHNYISQKEYSKKLESEVLERTELLSSSEKKYRTLVEDLREGIIITRGIEIVYANKEQLRMLEFNTLDELRQLAFPELLHPSDKNDYLLFSRQLRGDTISPGNYEVQLTKSNGEIIDVELSSSKITIDSESMIQNIVRDNTERKQIETIKSNAIIEGMENERHRISRDLHDEMIQLLTASKLQLEIFEYKEKIDDTNFTAALEQIDKAGEELRNIIHDLHPYELEQYGLRYTVEAFCEDVKANHGLNTKFIYSTSFPRLENKKELMIYRIIKEAINNIIKHSSSEKADIYFLNDDKYVFITIVDRGIGFNIESKDYINMSENNYGLITMQQRAKLIGANLVIESKTGKGTTISLKVSI